MRRTIAPKTLVVVLATVFVLGILPRAQADEHRDCSTASLQGSFGFTSAGTLNALPAPFSGAFGEIGRQTFDGQGNTEGAATATTNGTLHHFTFQGTYVVNPDCTGSMTLHVSPINARDFVIDDDGAELRAITTGNVPGNTETRDYKKQFARGRKDKVEVLSMWFLDARGACALVVCGAGQLPL